MGGLSKLGRWLSVRGGGGAKARGAAVRGLVSCAIVGATALSFNLMGVAPSGAATGTLSGWLAMDGKIQFTPTVPPAPANSFGWGNENTGSSSCAGVTGIGDALSLP